MANEKVIQIENNVPLSTNNGSSQSSDPFIFKLGSEYTPKSVDWLWKNYLARGKITLLAGESGTAKTTLAMSLAATISNAGMWPDNSGAAKNGFSLVYSVEDDPEDTHVPHIMAHGGKLDKIVFLEGKRDCYGNRIPFDPTSDFQHLLQYVRQFNKGLDLLIIDPIITIVKGDANQNNKVRQALQTISDLAKELNCAIVAIIHFAKNSQGRKVLDRILHSGAFVQVSRVVLNTAKVQDTEEHWLIRSKVSNGVPGGGMSYCIEPTLVAGNIETTRIHWNGLLQGDANELIAKAEGTWKSEDSTQIGKARALLLEMLKDGPKYSDDVYGKASELKISSRTLLNAKKDLNVGDYRTAEFPSRTVWTLSLRVA
jgi:putative DNA primase/helicase